MARISIGTMMASAASPIVGDKETVHRTAAGIVLALGLVLADQAAAETLAICGGVEGRAYFVETGLVGPKDAGWSDDRISAGRFTLSRDAAGAFDIGYSDASGAVLSATREGAKVVAVRLTKDEAAILVAYAGATVEVYQFVRDATGMQRLLLLQSKGGGPIVKAGVLMGRCSLLRLQ